MENSYNLDEKKLEELKRRTQFYIKGIIMPDVITIIKEKQAKVL